MSSFFVILGIIFAVLFLKFIWDSYLTDNTERRWRDYKQQTSHSAGSSNYDLTSRTNPGDLKQVLPNFMRFYLQLHPAIKAKMYASDATQVEFNMPINLFNIVVGYNHVGVIERNGTYEMYFYTLSSNGKKLNLTPRSFDYDLSVEQYEKILDDFTRSMLANPQYHNLAVGNDFFENQSESIIKLTVDDVVIRDRKDSTGSFPTVIIKGVTINRNSKGNVSFSRRRVSLPLKDMDLKEAKELFPVGSAIEGYRIEPYEVTDPDTGEIVLTTKRFRLVPLNDSSDVK